MAYGVMMDIQAFSPQTDTLTLAAGAASVNGQFSSNEGYQIRVYNGSSGVAFWRVSKAAAPVAVLTDTFVAPGATEVFSVPVGWPYFAVILSTGTGNVYAQKGAGL